MQHPTDKRCRRHPRDLHSRGFSLVELTMAFAIFLVASLAAYALFAMGTRSFKKAENATSLQQTTRAGFDRMIRELRLAGFNHNADGAPSRPDEQIEGAWDTAITFRADFDANDPVASTTPEVALAGTFNIVTTGNDEIVTYALGKPSLSGASVLSFVADVVEVTRDGDEETVDVPGVILVQNDPPYDLYRISLRNVSSMGGFDGTFDGLAEYTIETIADNIKSLTIRYYDATGNLLNPDTPADASDDIGGSDANRTLRASISRVEVELEGVAPNPDMLWTDPTDANPATQNRRKFNLEGSATPRNLGRRGIQDLDLLPPSVPTGLSACVGHCGGVLLTWNANPAGELVTQYQVAFGSTTGQLTQARTTGGTDLFIDGLNPTGTYYFAITASDAGGNNSSASAEINVTNINDTVPGTVTGFAAAPSTAEPGIIVSWETQAANDATVAGASGAGGCDFAKPVHRDLGGYALFRASGADPSTNPGDEILGPATLTAGAIQHLDTSVFACQAYTYDIRAEDACSVPGADQATPLTATYTTTIPPVAPENLSAGESGAFKNLVSWSPVITNVTGDTIAVAGYKIYRAPGVAGATPPDGSYFTLVGSSTSETFLDNYTAANAPPLGEIYFYRTTAVDLCPNESNLSAAAGALCAFDGVITISPGGGQTVYELVSIEVTVSGSDTYVAAGIEIFDSSGNSVFGPVMTSTYPFSFSWDTTSLLPDVYTIVAQVVNSAGCSKGAFSNVNTVTTPGCCLSQTGAELASDDRADSDIVVRVLANLCENDLVASEITVRYSVADKTNLLDDIEWNGVSVISGNNHPSPSTFPISVVIQSLFNGGGEETLTFDFGKTLDVGDSLRFDLTYSGAVVGEQTCSFSIPVE